MNCVSSINSSAVMMTRRLLSLSKFNNETVRLFCVPRTIVRRNIGFLSVQSKYLSFNKIFTTTTTTLSDYKNYRNVWSNGIISTTDSNSNYISAASSVDATPPLHSLTPKEITQAASVVKDRFKNNPFLRFVAITLLENSNRINPNNTGSNSIRAAEVLVLNTQTGIATEVTVNLLNSSILKYVDLPPGTQPMLTPDDCYLAENIVKQSKEVQTVLMERYGITDVNTQVAADPWSVHLADDHDRAMTRPTLDDSNIHHLPCRRLVQTFLYQRTIWEGEELQLADNHYAHPIDIVPVVDLNSQSVVQIDGLDRVPPPKVPQLSVNYHRSLIQTNSYLQTKWRHNALSALNITQPDGPSFTVTDNNCVTWQNWSLRVGFNYREGLVLHDVTFDERLVLKRASLVEMAVPYGDPNPPFQRKCAFDVGDYGLGFCANSLHLGCDCLGHIHYFDAVLNDAEGNPKIIEKAICMHEEDDGILWKHVEYRNGHNEGRRSRELVLSFIATVVNYEYLFYWRLKLDGTIDFEIRLSGELSTNLPSSTEDPKQPSYGKLVAPSVNAQVHQHMFCARLHMAVDGEKNTVSEVDVVPHPVCKENNPYGNAFGVVETVLKDEAQAVRVCDSNKARSWRISNAEGKVNPITGRPVSYKLYPFTRGAAQPVLLTDKNSCAVNHKGAFANANLWVTPYSASERYPAGEYTPQGEVLQGLPMWIKANRNIEGEEIVLWHAFGVTHIPRVEDFPVMPCESTGFSLKPDGFLLGNPTIDMEPGTNKSSKQDKGSCCN